MGQRLTSSPEEAALLDSALCFKERLDQVDKCHSVLEFQKVCSFEIRMVTSLKESFELTIEISGCNSSYFFVSYFSPEGLWTENMKGQRMTLHIPVQDLHAFICAACSSALE